ncbi:hypothetical protein [Alkalibacillus haloalkaliphilus]|uniref:hypothetical protein n=1 Tax=Alkalibacillus haloalkaliphilus TaxID=94136 RepID=UPI0029359386|nr:hypothetical protein [Alkalibacillus haloalkaliphilus]MDV2582776.1 hypothetical protein [Alkalibacillus haloalkaliphilus]
MRLKWTWIALVVVVVLFAVTTMSSDEEVDEMIVDTGEEQYTISGEDSLERFLGYWDEVEWGDHTMPNMERTQDVTVTHILSDSEEELDYVIWFHDDGSATIVSPKAGEGIGEWDEEFGMLVETELLD